MNDPFDKDLSPLDQVMRVRDILVSRATGQYRTEDDTSYRTLRLSLIKHPGINTILPPYIRTCSDLQQFWGMVKVQYVRYQERREFIWDSFDPVIQYLESSHANPGVTSVSVILDRFDAAEVHAVWEKALARSVDDPDGAITTARSLIETVCKHILDDLDSPYSRHDDLPKLWRTVAERLDLAPHGDHEPVYRAILGNCQSIVNNLAAIRNSVGDAHGQGRSPVKPAPWHAELAVNLAGTMTAFLLATWHERVERQRAE